MLKGQKMSLASREKMRLAKLGVKRGPFTEEHKQKIREAQLGEKAYWFGKKQSEESNQKRSQNAPKLHGEDNPNWRGDLIKVPGIHTWLERIYGKPHRCDNPNCNYKKTIRWDWALIHGKEYERKRKNFLRLCRSCHIKYDRNKIII